ncbi:GntR family transcriptional regulator [Bradyrhizobium sp. NP1]|uniref:GntR family transcriptional regulator n=1 Tax=Bradyrhizobium sp. NP1 TaxID=3049772 RepID=UPI0025A5A778|nr:GntR family transcriptional regulator [Bradyrhizobium sp. NP1]WJR80873.1 GntR family transcriptional regulator [Bradyrhizobium sp. NP1]
MTDKASSPIGLTAYQPLYAQVKALLLKRIGSGGWKPGEMLPNENELAAEYKVSQGTVRKALMALEADKMLVRRQGVGTFVARHSRDQALFQFFRIVDLDDSRLTPTSKVLTQRILRAKNDQASRLSIEPGAELHAIVRVRYLNSIPAIFERIFVPVVLMPDLAVEEGKEMGDEMYVIYQERFGISIARVAERLAAVAATAEEARHLKREAGAPLLEVLRVASDVNGRPVELRVSRCDTAQSRYAADIQ